MDSTKSPPCPIALNPDERWLVTGSQDYTARLWRTELAELRHLACITAGRNLSAAEWEQFFFGQAYHKSYADLPSP